jgi:hypothetical protein
MSRKVDHLLHGILEGVAPIEHATCTKTLPNFAASWERRWLAQRGIEIISAASRGLLDAAKGLRPGRRLPASENHIIWSIVNDELPTPQGGARSDLRNSQPMKAHPRLL